MHTSDAEDLRLRVGQLAKRTGLTVRTLHHWDHIGLLQPGHRTAAGHRLYGPTDLRRLQRILSLRTLGLTLEEIRTFLSTENPSLAEVLRSHRDRLRVQLDLLQDLESRLGRILSSLESEGEVTDEDLLITMERMAMFEKYFTKEQLEALEHRKEALGPEAIREAEEEWPRLIAAVREAMEKGVDPTSPEVRTLATRWSALVNAFSGGDRTIEGSLATMYKSEPGMATQQGLDPALFQYIGTAMRAASEE